MSEPPLMVAHKLNPGRQYQRVEFFYVPEGGIQLGYADKIIAPLNKGDIKGFCQMAEKLADGKVLTLSEKFLKKAQLPENAGLLNDVREDFLDHVLAYFPQTEQGESAQDVYFDKCVPSTKQDISTQQQGIFKP